MLRQLTHFLHQKSGNRTHTHPKYNGYFYCPRSSFLFEVLIFLSVTPSFILFLQILATTDHLPFYQCISVILRKLSHSSPQGFPSTAENYIHTELFTLPCTEVQDQHIPQFRVIQCIYRIPWLLQISCQEDKMLMAVGRYHTFNPPWRRTQNEGTLPSSFPPPSSSLPGSVFGSITRSPEKRDKSKLNTPSH